MRSDIMRNIYHMLIKPSLIGLTLLFSVLFFVPTQSASERAPLWEFQAIDTMKYSRDTARENIDDPSFDIVIDQQISNIKNTGATHVGVATPYDEEFYPFLKRWVDSARRHNLKVWFRGNMSGWEGWFGYPKIDRATHTKHVVDFITSHPELFENGDAFSSCPECENGGPGDPRLIGDAAGHKRFLIDEYNVVNQSFNKIGKQVDTRYHSMNGDVARLIMDEETTQALGNAVVVDHYVDTPEKLEQDLLEYSRDGQHDVILGEFGAPIPDIHGDLSEEEQAQWIDNALSKLVYLPDLTGLSYWTNVGGSTELWDGNGNPRQAVEILKKYYMPDYIHITPKNEIGQKIQAKKIMTLNRDFVQSGSTVSVPYLFTNQMVTIVADGYKTQEIILPEETENLTVVFKKEHEDFWFALQRFLHFVFFRQG